MSSTEWIRSKYDETFRDTVSSLERRRAEDKGFSPDDAKGVLKHLYVSDGNNWIGRGELQDTIMQATIDAYEAFIGSWEASIGAGDSPR